MSYREITKAIRNAAESVNNNGQYIHGRKVDASIFTQDATYPIIVLYPFGIGNPDSGADDVDRSTMIMAFLTQDSPDSTPEQREEIVAQMDDLVSEWKESVSESKVLRMSAFVREPLYQIYNGVSGMGVRFQLQTMNDEC